MSFVPILLLGQESVFAYHDQLDGDMLTYLLSARHLGESGLYQEMFNGITGESMFPPAALGVLLYKIFSPFVAFVMNHFFCMELAYTGMFLLVHLLFRNRLVALITGVFFSYLLLYSVYGLSIVGIPLLLYAFLIMYQNEQKPKENC